MKTLLLAALTALLLLTPARAQSQPAASAPGSAPSAPGDLAALEQFLNLSDAELAQMQQVIARLRAMTPAQRAALRDEMAAFRKLPEPQKLQLRQGWGWMPAEIQDGWREMMQGATPERRSEIQAKMQSLPPEEKTRYRRQLVEEFLKAKAARK